MHLDIKIVNLTKLFSNSKIRIGVGIRLVIKIVLRPIINRFRIQYVMNRSKVIVSHIMINMRRIY